MKAVFPIPEDPDMIPVNDQTRESDEKVQAIREFLAQRSRLARLVEREGVGA